MNERIALSAATSEEVDYFARRRCTDELSEKLYRYVAQTAPNGTQIARDDGTPIGIAIAHALETEWQLSEIFVEPSFRGEGIGLELLKAAAANASDVNRSGVIDARDSGAASFYVRRGIPLQVPIVRVQGEMPREEELARMAAGQQRFSTEPLDPQRHSAALAELDREIRGSARTLDHQYFSQNARGYVFAREAELAAYAYIWPNGYVGPIAVAAAAYGIQVLGFALAALRATHGAQWCSLFLPGTNIRMLRAALLCGLKVERAGVFATDNSSIDASRYAGLHELLF